MSFTQKIKYIFLRLKLNKLADREMGINRNLFWICGGLTVLVMFMATIELLSRGRFSTSNISVFYIGVLIIYSFHKEMIRWWGKRKVSRQGEYFVYGWIGLTAFLYFVNFISRDYFIHSVGGGELTTLRDVSQISLEVLAIFIITRSFKLVRMVTQKKKEEGENNFSSQEPLV